MEIKDYKSLLTDIKTSVRVAQTKAALAINAEMIMLYWDVGKTIKRL